jgi:phospholipid transport system substrate-binding protein
MIRRWQLSSGTIRWLWVVLLCVGGGAVGAQAGPSATVEAMHEALLGIMREADALEFEGRRERIEPVIIDSFDLPYVSRLMVSRSWPGLAEAQRERMTALFSALTVSTYAARFDGFSGQSFTTTGERQVRGGRRLVSTELRSPDDPPVRLDYLLHESDGRWRIVNVIADRVSEMALKKSEYATIIEAQGFEALLGKLERQVSGLGRSSQS